MKSPGSTLIPPLLPFRPIGVDIIIISDGLFVAFDLENIFTVGEKNIAPGPLGWG